MSNLYLEHHGILGQKWGVRRYQNKDGSRTAAGLKRERSIERSEQKAANSKIGFVKRYHTSNAVNKKYRLDRDNRIASQDTLRGKLSEAYGYKNDAARAKYASEIYSRNAKTFKANSRKRTRYESAAYNTKQYEQYANKMSKASTGKKIAERMFRDEYLKTKIKSSAGRSTTVGKELVVYSLTAGLGNIAMDTIYKIKNNKH